MSCQKRQASASKKGKKVGLTNLEMIIPSRLSDLSTNATSEVTLVMDYDSFDLEQKFNNEIATKVEAVLLETENLYPVDISHEGEESEPRSVRLNYLQFIYLAKSSIAPKVLLRRRGIRRLQLQAAQEVSEEGKEEVLLQEGRLPPSARGRPLPSHHCCSTGPAHILPGPGREAETKEEIASFPKSNRD